jgi:ribosomal protein S18 acetylase RimI-like enzyme
MNEQSSQPIAVPLDACGDIIRLIPTETALAPLVELLQAAFGIVAAEYGITHENAPSNPAFTTLESLKEYKKRPCQFFGYYRKACLVGCVAIEPSKRKAEVFYLERLAVMPEERHRGIGKRLVSHALEQIKARGGSRVSIGIINKNTILKGWYLNLGFVEREIKCFPQLPFEVCIMEKEILE